MSVKEKTPTGWECGTRLTLERDGATMQVVALAKTNAQGWMIMRSGGDIMVVPETRLRKWSVSDPCWEGPEEPLEIPEALRLVIEYLEVKSACHADASVIARSSPRVKAGLLIRTCGTKNALEACADMPKGWDPGGAVAQALKDAGCI